MLERILNWAGRTTASLYMRIMLKMDVQRHAPLPKGAKIIAANHPTTTDPFLMMALVPGPISILITEMCFKLPVLGHFLRGAAHVPVIDDKGRAAFEQAVKLLKAGHTLGIFPEGALSPLEGGVCPPHTGVARLALITGAPVIPVGIHLQRERIHFRETTVDGKTEVARWYFHGPYAMTVGEPMHFEGGVEDQGYVRAVSERIMQRIVRLARESEQQMRAPRTFDPHPTQPVRLANAH